MRVTASIVLALVMAAVLIPAFSGAPAAATAPRAAPPGTPATAHLVAEAALAGARELAHGGPESAVLAPDVVVQLGYTPVVQHGLAAKTTGACSSPVPLPARFEPACRVHDLGYDLLRVAHRWGAGIPDGLRSDLDTLLARQWRSSCGDDVPCLALAGTAAFAVRVNTSRQGHGAPVAERFPW